MSGQKIRHLLLDLDGTLLGSTWRLHPDFILGALAFFRRRGIGPIVGLRALRALRLGIEAHEPGEVNAARATRRLGAVLGLGKDEARALATEMARTVFTGLAHCFYPIEGAREFIEWARPRYELVLATNAVWPREIVALRVSWAGLDPAIFRFLANNDEMHHCKPSRHYYEELVALLRIEPGAALMVGDSVRKDLPAREAGIPVFLLSRGKGFNELRKQLEEEGENQS